ncbi:MAG TPA: hypothetical protein VLT45_18775, partial [Kofleriaceae bacterium]|nr:hypothetical protein [Kofleriaceae bacterium]
HGLVYRDELEGVLSSRAADSDATLAAQLDIAYSTRTKDLLAGQAAPPFGENELAALRAGGLGWYKTATSTSAQLAKLRKHVSELIKDPDHDPWASQAVDRTYYTVNNNFHQWDDDAIVDFVDQHTYATGMTPIVVQLGNEIGEDPPRYGNFFIVYPVNEDAVSVLGTEPVQILEKDLTRISTDAILDAARKKNPKP